MIGVLVKMMIYGILVRKIESVIKARKTDEYLDIKNCLCKKHLSDKLILASEDEILSTTETSLVDKNVACENNNFLIHIFH